VSPKPPKNLSAVLLTPVNNFLAVSLTPEINFRLFVFFSDRYQRHWGNKFLTGISDTGNKFFAGVVDTTEHLITGVNDTGDKH
jgi:hypothetical protein